jgi:rhodanese-related sulfurtransferase/predicted metal-dependent enzyme (double-stranded beta helix superfamily)
MSAVIMHKQIQQARFAAVQAAMTEIKRIAPQPVIDRTTLERLKPVLIDLASQTSLFPLEDFKIAPGKHGAIYELAVDHDGRFALYASAGMPGKAQPPHNHTTWAVISGVLGDEHNVGYERTDDRSVDLKGELKKRWELTCRKGNAVAFLDDDFHTIEVTSSEPTLHLHLYGLSLEQLPGRVFFREPAASEYKRFMARPEIYSPHVSAQQLRAMLSDGEELALLDVREGGVFAKRHLLTASNLPLSTLELQASALLPRKQVRIVLMDDDATINPNSLAQRAAKVLRHHGYLNLAVLQGGVESWAEAGYEMFSGTFVPSKAFGEVVEHENDTPRIEPEVLQQWRDEGRDMIVVDSRPMDEYKMMSIPGASDCPGAELLYRVPALVTSETTTIVVNCAGRTRSIIGAQSLRNAGLKNPIYALKNGTMGWHLAGLSVAKGADNLAPLPTAEGLAKAQALAHEVGRRYGVQYVTQAELTRMRLDDSRTTYVFDVRLPEEYEAGHLANSVSAPGGQLVQATDTYAAVRGARMVLVDQHGVQAVMTAHWLKQMGWHEVFVLRDVLDGALETGKSPSKVLGESELTASEIPAQELSAAIEAQSVEVIDVDSSLKYRKGRIPGAWYALRSRLAECLVGFAKDRPLVFTSSNGLLARYAAEDARRLGFSARVLKGGTAAWNHAGFKTEPSSGDADPKLLSATEDIWYRPYDRAQGVEDAMQQYLTWEVGLVEQLKRETYLTFSV